MTEFLDTTGVSYRLQQLIKGTNEKLILISPFLKISDQLKQSIEDKDRMKIDIRVIYGKNDLEPSEYEWLKSLRSVRTSFCKNLHAKCYMNEKEAIITSMNLYDYSQVNNYEMGIYVDKSIDPTLYNTISEEAMRLVRISNEIKITVSQVPKTDEKTLKPSSNTQGFCIRCGAKITLDPKYPYCNKCYGAFKKSGKDNQEEKHCHICGKPNESTLLKPSCYECYKTNKDKLEFPLA